MPDEIRIMIAAGGTGGHVFPAIAIADALRELYPRTRFLFVGSRDRMEWKAVPAAGYDIAPVWISGFHRRLTLKNFLFPLKLLVSLWQSRSLIRQFRPHALVSCGGFVSGPPGWVATRMSVPLFLQEQNSFPGVTNRRLASGATQIFIAFEEAARWFPKDKTACIGNPVRSKMLDQVNNSEFINSSMNHFRLDPDRPIILIMGGSGGAKSINDALLLHLEKLHDIDKFQIIWQCGNTYFEEIRHKLDSDASSENWPKRYPGLRLYGFMDDIAEAWAVADIIISRAGAITCSELLTTGKPGILVPSPWVAGDHQTHNAQSLSDKGAAILLADKDMPNELADLIRSLFRNPESRKNISRNAQSLAKKDAASIIANHILDFLHNSPDNSDKTSQLLKASA